MDIIHFNEMVKLTNLSVAVEYRDEHNSSGRLPYHNNQHMNFMLSDCFNAFLYDQLWDRGNGPVLNFPAIFYAAIFHDVDHSGGKTTDDINVDKAIAAWRTFVDSLEGSAIVSSADTYHGNQLREWVPVLIRATQYPYIDVTESEEYKVLTSDRNDEILASCNILRDADLMSTYHGPAGFELINRGLYEEMSATDSIYGSMTYAMYVEKQEAFLRNITWHTLWGTRRAVLMDWDKAVNMVILNAKSRMARK